MCKLFSVKHLLVVSLVFCSLILFGAATLVGAEDYPKKPIRLIYPFPAGSGGDISTRVLADTVSGILGKPVKVSNVTGGKGTIGAAKVARARKDGYELGSLPTGPAVSQTIFNKNVSYKTDDFEPICQFTYFPIVIVASTDKPYKNISELIAYAKKHPGQVSFAHPGQGSLPYMMMKELESDAGIKMKALPFKGLAPGVAAAVGGHVDIALAIYGGVLSFKEAGKLNILGLFANKRMKMDPEIPTVQENSTRTYPQNWCGIFAPKGLSPEVLDKLEKAFAEAVKSPEFEASMSKIKLPIEYLDAKAFSEKIGNDLKYFEGVRTKK